MKLRALTIASFAGLAALSSAQFSLLDNLSTLSVNPTLGTNLIESWNVAGGPDHVFRKAYLLRSGSATTASILFNQFGAPTVTTTTNTADIRYSGGGLSVRVFLSVIGGTTSATLSEIVTITNTGNVATPVTLFQYNDFDMFPTFDNDSITRLNSSTIFQSDAIPGSFNLTAGATGIPALSQISGGGFFPSLTSTAGFNLNTAAGAGIGQSFSNVDGVFAWQWDWNLATGQSVQISTATVLAVPEPGTIAALSFGALALLRRRNRK